MFARKKIAPLCLSLLLSAFFGCIDPDILVDDIAYLVDEARCDLRVGILSDTHLEPPHSDKMFQKALAYFKEREVDAVVLAGDVTQDGNLVQRRGVKKAWEKVFPSGNVALVVVTGERDTREVFETLTGRSFVPAFAQDVKGYTFLGANWKDETGVDAWALKPLLAKVGRDKPFFYVQNLVPYATCCTNECRPCVRDGGKVSYMLSKHPNAVAICGRSHTPLTDESAFWQGEFTCVNAGSFAYAKLRGVEDEPVTGVNHGLVMSVYGSVVVFERVDFSHASDERTKAVRVDKLGPAWKAELPAGRSPRKPSPVPQFWDDMRLMVMPSAESVAVRFPPVLARHTGVRAYAYEVRCVDAASGSELAARQVRSSAGCWSEEYEKGPVVCVFPRTELPKGLRVRFEVAPVDAFGRRGRTVSCDATL